MQSSFNRSSLVNVVGSVVALGFVIQTQVAMCGATTEDGDGYLPIVKVQAEYPQRAVDRGIEGSVTVEFTVSESGNVEDPVVVESDPPGIFDRAAIHAATQFKYRPRVVDGSPVRVEGVQHKIEFTLGDDPTASESQELGEPDGDSEAKVEDSDYLWIFKLRPKYPRRALQRGIEGFATVEFTVTEKGNVENLFVVEADPPGIFDRAAIHAATRFKYRPRVVDGSPVRVEGVLHRFDFKIENESTAIYSQELDGQGSALETTEEDGEYLPLVKVAPKYPPRALTRGIEGFATVEFAVSVKGNVEDPFVVESDPAGIFDRAAIHAASRFKYRPRVVDGSPIRVEGVKHRFDFKIGDESAASYYQELDGQGRVLETTVEDGEYLPLVKVRPMYPPRALARGIEGFVTVKYAVTEKGEVDDLVVIDSKPEGVFDRSATTAAMKAKYRPKIVDGSPVRVEGVKHTIVFELEN